METDWLRLIMAFLDQLRTKGAFFDVTYDQFLQNDGNKFLLSNTNIKWMPGMYADGMPYFLSDKEPVRKGVFDTLNSPAYRRIITGTSPTAPLKATFTTSCWGCGSSKSA